MTHNQSVSDTIASHMVRSAPLPEATRHAARRSLLDAYGVMLGATGLGAEVAPYRQVAMQQPGPCHLVGVGASVAPGAAALANGALAHALDFGDTFDAGPAHPSAALVPALWALADMVPETTLRDLLSALAMGGDLACRLAISPHRAFEDGGWYPPPLVNLIAGAAAGARLLRLDADAVRNAMGLALLAGAFPGEIKYDQASPIRAVREAFAARGAVEAALLAREGAIAFVAPIEGKAGFFAVYSGGAPRDRLLTGLGELWLNEQVSFKPWPSCRGTHAYIEAALDARTSIPLAQIVRIEAEIGPIQEMLIRPQPAKAAPARAIEAKFSIPFTVALALLDGAVDLTSFGEEKLADPVLRAMAGKVVELRNRAWGRTEAASGSLMFHLQDGSSRHYAVPMAAGHPDRPMSDDDLVEKFDRCARFAVQPWADDRARQFAARIMSGREDQRVAELFD